MDGSALSLNSRPRHGGGGALARRATRSLVLWSGGVDSTYALKRLLAETRDEVFSHHVEVQRWNSGEGPGLRSRFEALAIERLRDALAAETRGFVHTTSRVDLPACGPVHGQAALLAFLGGLAAMGHGFTPFDRILVGVNADTDPGWDPDSAACALRRTRLARALRAAWGGDEVPRVYLWDPRPHKVAMVDYLGPRLAALTVSCRAPREAPEDGTPGLAACGECGKCRGAAAWRRTPVALTAPGNGEAAPGRPLFRRLVEARSRTPAPPDAAAASDPPGP